MVLPVLAFTLRPRTAITGRDLVRSSLEQRMRELHVPAVSVAVLDETGSIHTAVFGEVIDDHSRFQAASISKPIAAMAAVALGVELDRDVNGLLNSTWQLPDGAGVTVRRLLSHTAGLSVHGFPGYESGSPVPELVDILDGRPPANTEAVRVVHPPGERAQYSGGGYTLLQLVLTQHAGRSFADLVRDAVLVPLGMDDSGYDTPPTGLVAGHDPTGAEIAGRWRIHPEQAAAGLWTTPADLLRAVAEVVEPRAVLDADRRDEMLTPVVEGGPGLGWMLDGDWFGHGGSNVGYRCEVIGSVTAGVGAAVMTNSDAAAPGLVGEILAGIADAYGWTSYLREREPADLTSVEKARIAGAYEVAPGLAVEVGEDGRDFRARLPGFLDVPVYAVANDELFVGGLETCAHLDGTDLVLQIGLSQVRWPRRDT